MAKTEYPHAGHRDRIRVTVENGGLSSLPEYQQLEYLLFAGIPYRDTKPIALELLSTFGSLKAVLCASVEDLTKIKCMTRNAALILRSYNDIYNSVFKHEKIILNADTIIPFIVSLFENQDTECFLMVNLKSNYEVINVTTIAYGNVDSIIFPTAKIIRIAASHNADKIILAHNHPSDCVAPSHADERGNGVIREDLGRIGIEYLDHFIVGKTCVFSCAHGVRISADENAVYPHSYDGNKKK